MRLVALWNEWRYLGGKFSANRVTTAIWNTYFDTWIASGDWHLVVDDEGELWCRHLRWAWQRSKIPTCPHRIP